MSNLPVRQWCRNDMTLPIPPNFLFSQVGVSFRKFSQVPTKKIETNIKDFQLLAMSQPYPKEAWLQLVVQKTSYII